MTPTRNCNKNDQYTRPWTDEKQIHQDDKAREWYDDKPHMMVKSNYDDKPHMMVKINYDDKPHMMVKINYDDKPREDWN